MPRAAAAHLPRRQPRRSVLREEPSCQPAAPVDSTGRYPTGMPEAQGEHPTGKAAVPRRRPARRRRRTRPRAAAGKGRSVALHQRSASHFRPKDREHGKSVFSAGAVKLEVDGATARAIVPALPAGDGGAPADPSMNGAATVEIDWSRVPDERILHAVCECPQFVAGTACGHIWASLLELAASAKDSQPAGSGRVSLRKTRPPQVSIPGSALDAVEPAAAAANEAPAPLQAHAPEPRPAPAAIPRDDELALGRRLGPPEHRAAGPAREAGFGKARRTRNPAADQRGDEPQRRRPDDRHLRPQAESAGRVSAS